MVENRAGGGNVIGAQVAARAEPDGYNFFFATAAALVTNPYTFKVLPYDAQKDFVPVSMIAEGPFLVLANPSVPAKNSMHSHRSIPRVFRSLPTGRRIFLA